MNGHSRRGFLSRAIGACFAGAGVLEQAALRAGQARVQSAVAAASLFDLQQTSPNVYLALARPAAMLNCNAAIFVRSDHVVVVDSHSKPSAAASLVAQIRREVTTKPVRYLVNTHFHYDHAQGNAAYRALSPRVDVVASRETRQLLAERGAKAVASGIESMRRAAESARAQLSTAPSNGEKQYYRRAAAEAEAFVREMQAYRPDLPDVTFDTDLTLRDSLQELHLVFRGRAHTGSDICVLSPSARSLATGDLIVGFLPGMGDGFPSEWPGTLDRMDELPFDNILPGHGDFQRSRETMGRMKAYIEELCETVARLKRQGMTLDEVLKQVTPATLPALSRGGYGAAVAASEGRYRLRPPGFDPQQGLASALRGNVAAVYQKLVV